MTDASELEKFHIKPKQIIGLKQNILHKVGLPNGHKSTGYFFLSTLRICSYLKKIVIILWITNSGLAQNLKPQ